MKRILLASNNIHKVKEIQSILKNIKIVTPEEIDFTEEVEETFDTFEGNAGLKAVTLFNEAQIATLADDSGLEVMALKGAPGVFSKRYAGTGKAEDNIAKIINELKSVKDRSAQFRTVLCFFEGKEKLYFEGTVKGKITREKKGKKGFGYDSIFIPEGYDKTFAELEPEVKNIISHRAIAIRKFSEYISNS
ncbi:MAG: RdgB/HAM1 family non-canonical purine NTP pyrophosphatase [Flavobacteriales bacterium]